MIEKQEVELEEKEEVNESEKERLALKAQADENLKKAQEAEKKAARAEGEVEALRRGQNQVSQWTDEQWEMEGQKRGYTGQQYKELATTAKGISDYSLAPIREELERTKREAKEAREEARRAKSGTSLYAIEKEFYEKHPELTGRKGDVNAYLDKLSPEVKEDPKKYSEALEDARIFARGKAREDLSLRRSGKTENTKRDEFAEGRDEEIELDVRDLKNDGSKRLIENLFKNPGGDDFSKVPALDEVDRDKAFEMCKTHDDRGVEIDERGEWARGQRMSEKAMRELKK